MRFLLLLLFVAITPLYAGDRPWASPEGFFAEEVIERQTLAPGLEWIAARGTLNSRPIETHILSVDLATCTLKPLIGSRHTPKTAYFPRSPISTLRAENNALAAVNASFFDIRATQSPSGLVMKERRLLRNPEPHRPSLLFNTGRATLAPKLEWHGTLRVQGESHPLAGINAPGLKPDQEGLYVAPWMQTLGPTFQKDGAAVLEIIGKETTWSPSSTPTQGSRLAGKITEIRKNQSSRPLQKGEFILATLALEHPVLSQLKEGDSVEIEWSLANTPGEWTEWSDGLAGNEILFQGETWKPAKSKARHPRTAVGIHPEGNRVLLVIVDGRSEKSTGMDMDELRNYLRHLGAHEALNLDGGGSSAVSALLHGTPRTLNNPSDRLERYVPTGLGVFPR